jgi:hypothetical protein
MHASTVGEIICKANQNMHNTECKSEAQLRAKEKTRPDKTDKENIIASSTPKKGVPRRAPHQKLSLTAHKTPLKEQNR